MLFAEKKRKVFRYDNGTKKVPRYSTTVLPNSVYSLHPKLRPKSSEEQKKVITPADARFFAQNQAKSKKKVIASAGRSLN